MLKHCPKCKSFFEDDLLRFCLKDGSPLVEINETSSFFTEGRKVISETNRKIVRETRINQLKTILKTLILVMMVIMIITVITLRSWVYLYKPEAEIVQNNPTQERQPEILTSEKGELGTPTPTPKPSIKPTPSPITTVTPTPEVSPSVIKKIETCNAEEGLKAEKFLESDSKSYFYQSVINVEQRNAIEVLRSRHPILAQRNFSVYPDLNITATVSKCSTASVKVEFSFYPSIKLDIKIEDYKGTMNFVCNGSKTNWSCK